MLPRRAPALAAVATILLATAIGPGLAEGQVSPQFRAFPAVPAPTGPQFREAEAADERRQAETRTRRATPEAREARRRSRKAYSGKSRTESIELARQKFKQVVLPEPFAGLRLKPGERVLEYLGDEHWAKIKREGAEGEAVVHSLAPLRIEDDRGEKRPVDLNLTDEGGAFTPENAIVESRIPKDLSEGILLQGAGFKARHLGAGVASSEPTLVSGKAFYPSIERDTDLLVMPTLSGVETFLQLRSEDSPEDHDIAIDVPPGAHLREGGNRPGAVEIVRGALSGELPVARDA